MGGYQLAISLDIFRGRYRQSFSNPSPIPANKVQEYKFRLPTVNHVFQPGHRIMVQVQSSLFPLYDRNPQKYVPEHLLREEGGLPEGDGDDHAWRKDAEQGVAAGRAARPAASVALGGPVAACWRRFR